MLDLKMEVYTPALELIGFLEIQRSVIWSEKAFSAGKFSVESLITAESMAMLKPENIIWIEGDTAGIIEYVQEEAGESGPYITVKGYTLTGILDRRVLWGLYNLKGTAPAIMHKLVIDSCIIPTRGDVEARKIPGLVALDPPSGGDTIQFQATGGTLLERLEALGETYGVAFGVRFTPAVPQMEFWTRWGQNRSIHQSENNPVLYSTELDDVLSSEYTYNSQDYRNVALVAGEGDGTERVYVTVENDVEPTPEPVPPTPPEPPVTQTYTVTATVDPPDSGNVTGAGQYKEGATVNLKAMANDGYDFSEWKEGGSTVHSGPEYSFVASSNRDLVAAFAETKPSRLPAGYTEVEYIQSSGTQYIDTRIRPTSTIKTVIDAEPLNANSDNTSVYFYGCSYVPSASGTKYYFLIRWYNGVEAGVGSSSAAASFRTLSSDGTPRRMKITVDYAGKKAFVEGESEVTLNVTNTSASMPTIKLLGINSGSGLIEAKLYSFYLKNSSTLMELVPCKNPSGAAGMYDLIGGAFYGNAGAGTFTAGPAV